MTSDFLETLDTWETRLRQELRGLSQVKGLIDDQSSFDPALKVRFLDIIRSLKVKIVSLLSHCSKLRDDSEAGIDITEKAAAFRDEYKTAIRSIEKLLQVAGSRPAEVKIRPSSAGKELSKDPVVLLLQEIEGLKRLVQRTEVHIDTHSHPKYVREVKELMEESDKLTIEVAVFAEQHKTLMQQVKDLEGQISVAEQSRRAYNGVRKPNYLLPQSGKS